MATTVTTSRPHKRKNDTDEDENEEKPIIAKTPTDLQRLRLEKLMKNPEKPVPIPERPKEKSMPHVPDFVRNVMGSSAGAGSGEFHVYRHLRRKEYARQKFIQEKAEKETKEDEYHRKLKENQKLAEERTAKKRAKRLKKKQNMKHKKKWKPTGNTIKTSEPESEESDSEQEEEETEKSKKENTFEEQEQQGKHAHVFRQPVKEATNKTDDSNKDLPQRKKSNNNNENDLKLKTVGCQQSYSDESDSD